jgi:hypothetical protein
VNDAFLGRGGQGQARMCSMGGCWAGAGIEEEAAPVIWQCPCVEAQGKLKIILQSTRVKRTFLD